MNQGHHTSHRLPIAAPQELDSMKIRDLYAATNSTGRRALSLNLVKMPRHNLAIGMACLFLGPTIQFSSCNGATPGPASETAAPTPATLHDYAFLALRNNSALQAAYQKFQAAEHRAAGAGTLPDPMIGFGHFIENVETRLGPMKNQVMVSQMLPWFGKLDAGRSVASHMALAAAYEYESQRLQILRDTGTAYYDYAYLGRRDAVTRETRELLKRLAVIVDDKVRAGGNYSQQLRVEIETEKLEDRLRQIDRARRRQDAKIRALLGIDPAAEGSPLLPVPVLEDPKGGKPEPSELRQAATGEHPSLKQLGAQAAAAQQRQRLARLAPIPDPTIGANYTEIGNGGDDALSVTVSFRIPLWFRKYREDKLAADAELAAAGAALASRHDLLAAEFEIALQRFREESERVAAYRDKLLPAGRQALEVTEGAYRGDQASVLDLIDSERTLLDLEDTYWRAVANREISRIHLQTLAGESLTLTTDDTHDRK